MKTNKIIKSILIIALLFFAVCNSFAQNNEMKAKIEYEDAETAFQNKEYDKVITYLSSAEKLLGRWTPKVSFLKIQALDIVTDYGVWSDNTAEIYRQVKEYMKYADKNPDKVDLDRMREIYKIDKIADFAKKKKDFEEDTDYKAGKAALEKKEYEMAMNHYLKAAQKNNTRAMDAISDMFRDGIGVDRDYEKSIEWDTKASKLGDPICTSDIGTMYGFGYGVPKDYKKALEYFLIGAEYDIVYAISYIGDIYRVGENGVTQNYTEAMKWYKKAADKGNSPSMNQIGILYHNGRGTTKNYQEAMNWYKKAADKGNTHAMGNIAHMYKNGDAVEKNYKEAISWFEKIIQVGQPLNVVNTGEMGYCHFQLGNYTKSMEWYKKAYEIATTTESKNIYKNWIAKMYEEGLGVPKDKKMAKEWRNK